MILVRLPVDGWLVGEPTFSRVSTHEKWGNV